MFTKRSQQRPKPEDFIEIIPGSTVVPLSHGRSLLDCLLDQNIEINHSCGGMGSCGTCRAFVEQGIEKLNPRNEIEKEMAQDRGFSGNERLCCQSISTGSIKIRIP